MVEAPVAEVAGLLLAVRPGPVGPDNLWLLDGSHAGSLSGGPERFTLHAPGHTMTVEVSRNALALQGSWWYRGEYLLRLHPRGTRLVHRVLNVARRSRWAVPMANRFFVGFEDGTRKAVGDLLRRTGDRLGRPAYPE
ncbi:hypothetical protein [Streptosporangium sandarakinum]|uniref:hypothetical protein n=1 Tax=Streptosporangium sandarakinum TaxID=1260955 RepID=UPI0037229AC3